MARASKYKWEKGDEVGLYKVIKVLPSEEFVKNLVILCECLLCHAKVKRWSNRLESKHRGCTAVAKIEKEPEPAIPVVHVKPHTRADGALVETNDNGNVIGEIEPAIDVETEDLELGDLDLPAEVLTALNFNVDAYALELIKRGESLDNGTKLLFMTTVRRYLTLVHLARKLEKKMAMTGELTVLGSQGNQVASPLLTQYKALSSESNATAKILNNIVSKLDASDGEKDPLLEALAGGGAD